MPKSYLPFLVLVSALSCSKGEAPKKALQAPVKAVKMSKDKTTQAPAPKTQLSPEKLKVLHDNVDRYTSGVRTLISSLQSNTPASSVAEAALSLTNLGVEITSGMAQAHPQCAQYFQALADAAPKLPDLDLATLERDYHEGKALPKNPSRVCYHGKDLVVHPGTVAAIARMGLKTKDLRDKAIAELNEVIAHGLQVKMALKPSQKP